MPIKDEYGVEDIGAIFDQGFRVGFTAVQLFLGISKDELQDQLGAVLGAGQIGARGLAGNRGAFFAALQTLGLSEAMASSVHFKPAWSDILVERLRSGRGKAIKGQKRGRGLEDFTEQILRNVFGASFQARCQFTGVQNRNAKCDFAIPDRNDPRILIESKGYGATGSKMTDVVGDVNRIIDAKRPDVPFILVTDGITWTRRVSDLRKLLKLQNEGKIMRIYTTKMAGQLEADLRLLKSEHGL